VTSIAKVRRAADADYRCLMAFGLWPIGSIHV
jgi:hypothetical protein